MSDGPEPYLDHHQLLARARAAHPLRFARLNPRRQVLVCYRCWYPFHSNLNPALGFPKQCPHCRSPYWRHPRGTLPMGRPANPAD